MIIFLISGSKKNRKIDNFAKKNRDFQENFRHILKYFTILVVFTKMLIFYNFRSQKTGKIDKFRIKKLELSRQQPHI